MSTAIESPPQKAQQLEAFLGAWSVKGTIDNGDSQSTVTGKWEFQRALDGWGVLGTMTTEIEGLGSFSETGVFGFDADTGSVHMFGANKYAIRDHFGDWVGDDRLTVRWEGVTENGPVSEEITVHFVRPGQIHGFVEEKVGGVTVTTDLELLRSGPIGEVSE